MSYIVCMFAVAGMFRWHAWGWAGAGPGLLEIKCLWDWVNNSLSVCYYKYTLLAFRHASVIGLGWVLLLLLFRYGCCMLLLSSLLLFFSLAILPVSCGCYPLLQFCRRFFVLLLIFVCCCSCSLFVCLRHIFCCCFFA